MIFLSLIVALFLIGHAITHRGSRPWIRTSFPEISDWRTLKITLDRSPCLGNCPVYNVSIDGLGNVSLVGEARSPSPILDQTIHHHSKISEASVHALFDAFRQAQFFWLYDEYGFATLDGTTYKIGIEYDGHKKEVIDNHRKAADMPKEVTELENLIDRVTGVRKLLILKGLPPVDLTPPEPSLKNVKSPKPLPPDITIEDTDSAH